MTTDLRKTYANLLRENRAWMGPVGMKWPFISEEK